MTLFVIGGLLGIVIGFATGQYVADFRRGMHDARQAMKRRSAHRKR